MRRLYVTKSGYWYIGMTIALGVVAIASGNNVLYLIECLLLGGMILSGVVSEKAISSIEATLVRRQAIAGTGVHDELRVRNSSRLPFFCIEILEWSDGEFVPLLLIPRIEPGARSSLASTRVFQQRGAHQWQGLGVATAGPFGFARKIRILHEEGSRLVWPAHDEARRDNATSSDERSRGACAVEPLRTGQTASDAEVRLYTPDDDARSIVWKLSGKGEDPVVRKKTDENPDLVLRLDLRVAASPAFEQKIRQLAAVVYQARKDPSAEVRLLATGHHGIQRISGHRAVLDFLATARAEGLA